MTAKRVIQRTNANLTGTQSPKCVFLLYNHLQCIKRLFLENILCHILIKAPCVWIMVSPQIHKIHALCTTCKLRAPDMDGMDPIFFRVATLEDFW